MRSLKARKGARSSLTLERTQPHTGVQDLPRHQHSDPRLSVSFQSQTRWMAGEWKSWLKPNPIPLLPSTARERPSILFATTLMPRGLPPPRYSTLRSRIIPLRVSLYLKCEYILKTHMCYIFMHICMYIHARQFIIIYILLYFFFIHGALYMFLCNVILFFNPQYVIIKTKPRVDKYYFIFLTYVCSTNYFFPVMSPDMLYILYIMYVHIYIRVQKYVRI